MNKPTLLSRIVWRILRGLYRWKGFKLSGGAPDIPKYILLGAPHTTNWDFIFFAGAVRELGIKPNFVGKHTLFNWPMTRFMFDMGGIPVDRRKKDNYVQTVIAAIGEADEIPLVVAPEGSPHRVMLSQALATADTVAGAAQELSLAIGEITRQVPSRSCGWKKSPSTTLRPLTVCSQSPARCGIDQKSCCSTR